MATAIDLYHCTVEELTRHVSSPRIPMSTLERYVKETLKLIQRQKEEDKAEHAATSRSRTKKRPSTNTDTLDLDDTASVTSTNSRGRRSRAQSSSRRDRSRKRSTANKMEEDSEEEPETSTTAPTVGKSASVEYSWMAGVKDEHSDSSSEDPLLRDSLLKEIDGTDIDALLSDTKETKKSHRSSSRKKKHRRHKKDRKKRRKHKSKKKKHRRKGKESDDDYLADDTDADFDEDWDAKTFERTLHKWSLSRLQKEEKSLISLIEAEKTRHKRPHRKKSRSPFIDDDDSDSVEEETDEDRLGKLTEKEIIAKFEKLKKGARNKDNALHHNGTAAGGGREDPSKLYCICRKPHDGMEQMICCDYCEEWYHLPCIGLSADKLQSVEHLKFKCPVCNGGDINDVNGIQGGSTVAAKRGTFDSPKSTPNPRDPSQPLVTPQQRVRRKPRRFISDTTDSETDRGRDGHQPPSQRGTIHTTSAADKAKIAVSNERCAKYEKLIVELQNRLKEGKNATKRTQKEMAERLQKAKGDIDEERKRRIAVEQHLESAKSATHSMVADLEGKCKMQEQKEVELVNKLKKLESNKKKYKESASDNKKRMKQLKEEHEARLTELENEIIPTLREQVAAEKKKAFTLEQQMKLLQQHSESRQQQAQATVNALHADLVKVQGELSRKMAEDAKLQNLNSQLTHKMSALHVQAQQNHQQWEAIAKAKEAKVLKMARELDNLQQQNNALRSQSNLPQVIVNNLRGDSNSRNVGEGRDGGRDGQRDQSTPCPPSPIKMPSTPSYLKFNDLELEELKMCRELCQKLLAANLFQVEHMAMRANLTQELFVSWVTGVGVSPTVVNDLNRSGAQSLPQLDPQQHVSMNSIRSLLIEIRKQLENISKDVSNHDEHTIKKVTVLLRDFQSASQSYEQKMNEFKRVQHNRLLEQCRTRDAVLEMLCVVGTNEDGSAKSEWIKATVCNFEQQANRVLVRKATDGGMQYAAIDAATLRLPENKRNEVNGGGGGGGGQSQPLVQPVQPLGQPLGQQHNGTVISGGAIGGALGNASSSVSSVVSPSAVLGNGNMNVPMMTGQIPVLSRAQNAHVVPQQGQPQQGQQPQGQGQGQGQMSYWNTSNMNTSNMMVRPQSTPNLGAAPGAVAFNPAGGSGAVPGGGGGGQMNFRGIPNIPQFQANGPVLPSFGDLQANANANNANVQQRNAAVHSNVNGISSNSTPTNSNSHSHSMAIGGGVVGSQQTLEHGENGRKSKGKNASRKRKRDEKATSKSNKKKKKSSKHNDDSSDSEESSSDEEDDSDISSDDTEEDSDSDAESRRSSKRKKRRRHKKGKKSKRSSSSRKKRDKKRRAKEEAHSKKRHKKVDDDARSVRSTSSTASNRKRGRKKRSLDGASKSNGHHPAKKRQKTGHHNGHSHGHNGFANPSSRAINNKSDFVVMKNGAAVDSAEDVESDKNDSVCRICKHPGDLVCCEGCPSAYHADCIRPRIKRHWLDAFEEWHCPSCAPRHFYVPVKERKSGEKWPQHKEPLLKDLAVFLKKHPFLERDFEPDFHHSRKGKEM